jgi:hypothetical protein
MQSVGLSFGSWAHFAHGHTFCAPNMFCTPRHVLRLNVWTPALLLDTRFAELHRGNAFTRGHMFFCTRTYILHLQACTLLHGSQAQCQRSGDGGVTEEWRQAVAGVRDTKLWRQGLQLPARGHLRQTAALRPGWLRGWPRPAARHCLARTSLRSPRLESGDRQATVPRQPAAWSPGRRTVAS